LGGTLNNIITVWYLDVWRLSTVTRVIQCRPENRTSARPIINSFPKSWYSILIM